MVMKNFCKCEDLISRIEKLESHQEDNERFKNKVDVKLDRIEEHHRELLTQQTRQSGNIALLANTVELQQKDREEKHKQLMGLISGVYDMFNKHIEKEEQKYDDLKKTQNDTKWKTKVMWSIIITIGTGLTGFSFWLIQEFIKKAV